LRFLFLSAKGKFSGWARRFSRRIAALFKEKSNAVQTEKNPSDTKGIISNNL
jgi:hypothetical protein